jgi:hypothetical protein
MQKASPKRLERKCCGIMTNTYSDDEYKEIKIAEELRCIRCALERLLRHYAPEEFVDYEMEKFGRSEK